MHRLRLKVTAVVLAVSAGVSLTGFVAADTAEVNAVDAVAALESTAPSAVSNVADARSDSDTAELAAVAGGATVSIPVDASDGIQLDNPGSASDVRIGLPFAENAGAAALSQKAGVVVYDNDNGSSTVPVAHTDGTLQISTVIAGAKAPTRYEYPIDAPGQTLRLAADGSAFLSADDGIPTLYIASPWAKDANGNDVPTHYEVNGNTLSQVVDFTAETAFPVVADPSYGIYPWGYVVKFNKSDTKSMARSTDISTATAMCGLIKNILGSVVCGLLGAKGLGAVLAPLYSAARHGNCVQSNQPWVPIPPTLYEVRC